MTTRVLELLQKARERDKVIDKIVQTEVEYINQLSALMQVKSAIKHDDYQHFGVSQEHFVKIFNNSHELVEYHQVFLKDLGSAIFMKDTVMNVLCFNSTFRQLYLAYIHGHDRSLWSLRELKTNEAFQHFLTQKKKQKKIDLVALLRAPIDRIESYITLYNSLLDLTSPEHPDHQKIVGARDLLKEIEAENNPISIPDDIKHRDKIVDEIVQTEVVYVKSLTMLITHYKKPLETTKSLGVSKEQIASMFSNIQQIKEFHKTFLKELGSAIFLKESVAEAFLVYSPFMKMYTQYMNTYEDSMNTIKHLTDNSKFRAFVQAKHGEIKMDLPSLLIMPVQRIPRYVLLLQQMIKYTKEDHPEYKKLLESCESLTQIANHINESKRHVEDMSKLVSIQSRVTTGSLNLVQPHRKIVREGTLKSGTKIKPRVIFLFSDIVMWTNMDYKYKEYMPLLGIDVTKQGKHGFRLKNGKKSADFACETEKEVDEWIEQINKFADKRKEMFAKRWDRHRSPMHKLHQNKLSQLAKHKPTPTTTTTSSPSVTPPTSYPSTPSTSTPSSPNSSKPSSPRITSPPRTPQTKHKIPGTPRTAPGTPRTAPGTPRTAPGTPQSNPATRSRSPGKPISSREMYTSLKPQKTHLDVPEEAWDAFFKVDKRLEIIRRVSTTTGSFSPKAMRRASREALEEEKGSETEIDEMDWAEMFMPVKTSEVIQASNPVVSPNKRSSLKIAGSLKVERSKPLIPENAPVFEEEETDDKHSKKKDKKSPVHGRNKTVSQLSKFFDRKRKYRKHGKTF